MKKLSFLKSLSHCIKLLSSSCILLFSIGISAKEKEPLVFFLGGLPQKIGGNKCWKDNGSIDESLCRVETETCSSDTYYKNPEVVSFKTKTLSPTTNLHYYENTDGVLSNIRQNQNSFEISVPVNTRLTVFSSDRYSYTIFYNDNLRSGMAPDVLKPSKPTHKITFVPEEGWLTEHQRIEASFLGKDFGYLSGPRTTLTFEDIGKMQSGQENSPPSIWVPEGDFEATFYYTSAANTTFEQKVLFSIKKASPLEQRITIHRKDFRKKIYRNYRSIPETLTPYMQNMIQKGFLQIPQIKIIETNKRIDHFYKVVNGELKLKDELKSEFQKEFDTLSIFGINISGQCSKIFPYKLYEERDLYLEKNGKFTLLGKLQLVQDSQGIRLAFLNESGAKESFHSSIHAGSCSGQASDIFYHQPIEQKNGFVNLGKGPWGENGWIKGEARSLYDSGITFRIGENRVSIQKQGSKYFAVGTTITVAEESGDIENHPYNAEISEGEFLDDNGKIKLEFDCSFGC